MKLGKRDWMWKIMVRKQGFNLGWFIFIHDMNHYDGVRLAIENFCEQMKIGYFCSIDVITAFIDWIYK